MVRVLNAEDADAFRALRLEGLRDSPTAFGASYDDELQFTQGELVHRIDPTDNSWILGAFDEQNVLIGCIGWYRARGEKVSHKSHIWGMYVTPRHRRKGIARALATAVIERVRTNASVRQVELFVASGNNDAASLYQGLGFGRVAVHPRSLFVNGRYIDEELFVLYMA